MKDQVVPQPFLILNIQWRSGANKRNKFIAAVIIFICHLTINSNQMLPSHISHAFGLEFPHWRGFTWVGDRTTVGCLGLVGVVQRLGECTIFSKGSLQWLVMKVLVWTTQTTSFHGLMSQLFTFGRQKHTLLTRGLNHFLFFNLFKTESTVTLFLQANS